MENKRQRIHLLDEIRGLAIILMVFYHAFFLFGYFFGFEFMQKAQLFFEPLQPLFACLFILISGISSNLSKSNLKRGTRLLLIALGFTAVTVGVLPRFGVEDAEIIFGILHLLSVSMLLYALLEKLLSKVPMNVGAVVCLVMFFATYSVQSGKLIFWQLPDFLYANSLTATFGFPPDGFYSADYFPLFPFVFMFFAGTFFGRLAENNAFPAEFYRSRCKPLAAVGKKTLVIYVLHWPILFLLGLIISKF